MWSARVHKTGSQIQLLKDGSVTKIIRSASDTFAPVEAKDFASNLVNNLNEKVAKQMTNPGAQPSVATESDQHQKSLKAVNSDAKGTSPKDMAKISAVIDENTNLKKKIAKLEKEANVERKARRGLAIVKTLVDQKKVANDQSVIKNEVMKIVAMSNDEISLLERKVAGLPLYESTESAEMASRRYARHARLHRQAAEDAQIAGNDTLADEEDARAANYEDLSKQAADSYSQFNAKPEGVKSDDVASQVNKPAKGVDAQGKKASTDEDDDDDLGLDDEKVASDEIDEIDDDIDDDEESFEDDESADDELIEAEEDFDVEAAASIYRKIAANHTKKAEELKAAGDDDEAGTEMEIADEAEQLASAVESSTIKEASGNTFKKEAADIYRKIAAEHRKKADDLEAIGQTDEADIEDEIADEAEQLAACVETKTGETETPVKTSETEAQTKTSETDNTKKAGEQTNVKEATTETETKDADETDPLAAMIEEDKSAEVEDAAETNDDMPTDEEIMAAVSGPEDDDVAVEEDTTEKVSEAIDSIDDLTDEVVDSGEEKEAGDKGTKKTANAGYQASEFDKTEQNPMTADPVVRELEGMWRKDNQ